MIAESKDSETLTIFIEWNDLTTIVIGYITSVHCTATTNIWLYAGCIGLWCTNNDPGKKCNKIYSILCYESLFYKLIFLIKVYCAPKITSINRISDGTKVNKEDNRLFFFIVVIYYRITLKKHQTKRGLLNKNHMPNMVL